MSVAAMTMDDQRPLMNSYDKMSTKYDQSLHIVGTNNNSVVGVGGGGGVAGSCSDGSNNIAIGSAIIAAPPSGPASPTPSGCEELTPVMASTSAASSHHQYTLHSHHHHNNHHHHHHHHQHQQQQQHQHQQQQQQQQQQEKQKHEQQQQQQPQHAPAAVQSNAIAEAVAAAEQRQRLLEDEIDHLKLEQTRLAQQYNDAQRREKILMRRLANKEQEFQDYVSQIAEYKVQQAPTAIALRTALLDPAVNLLFERLKKELKATKAKLEETQNELTAWKFTPDSNTGKRLMAKCRLLYQENEELGKMTSNGRLAKLETELAMQKSFSEEVKKSQSELDDFLQELDEDVEGMQSTILFLQQELKQTRDRVQTLEKENYQLKNGHNENEASNDSQQTNSVAAAGVNGKNNGINIANEQAITAKNVISNTVNNEYKYQGNKLETIDENASLKIALPLTTAIPTTIEAVGTKTSAALTAITATVPADYYHHSNEQQQQQQQQLLQNQEQQLGNEEVNKNGRVARKRNYEEDIAVNYTTNNANAIVDGMNLMTSTTITTATREVNAPRTLPPKKSKLRGIAARRNSQLEECIVSSDVAAPLQLTQSNNVSIVNMLVDNAVAGMASEEFSTATLNSGTTSMDITAQTMIGESVVTNTSAPRILTRRRSVRQMAQNGGNGGGAGGGGGNEF